MRPQRQSDQGTNTRALGSVRGGTVAYQKYIKRPLRDERELLREED